MGADEPSDEPLMRRRRVGPTPAEQETSAARQSSPPEREPSPPQQQQSPIDVQHSSPPPEPQPQAASPQASSSQAAKTTVAESLWPDPGEDFPFHLFDTFVFPRDEGRFEESSIREIADLNAEYLSKASACTGRLIHKLEEAEQEERRSAAEAALVEEKRKAAVAGWHKEHEAHARTTEQLKTETAEVQRLKAALAEAEESRAALADSNTQLQKECDKANEACSDLKKERAELNQIGQQMNNKIEILERKLEITEADFAAYRSSAKPLTEEVKQEVIADYRSSDAMVKEIMEQFELGYVEARAKDKGRMEKHQYDPHLLDTSDDEPAV